jgi:ribose transport system ATP-binding protein
MADAAEAVSVAGISKSFGATTALDDASFSARPGEVLALLGENGAGKSTMVKLLSGLIQPDSGVIKVDGQTVRLRRPADAHRHGIQTAFQEMTLVPDLSVGENMLISAMPTGPLGLIRHRAGREKVEAHLAAMGLGFVDPRREARDYDLAIRQKIEIARAVMRTPRLLLLDEPTSTLSGRDIDWLGDLIAHQKARGVTVIFISHRLPEVRRFCDRLTVLRNGTDVGTSVVDEVDDDTVVKMIIGRSLSATFPPKPEPKPRSAARSRCWRHARLPPRAASRMPRSSCGRGRFSASPACRAWASGSCFWPASAWPPRPAGISRSTANR